MASCAPCSICLPSVLLVALAAGGHGDGRLDGAEEADLDGLHVLRFRDRAARPGVFHLHEEVLLERLDVAEGLHVVGGVGVAVVSFSGSFGRW